MTEQLPQNPLAGNPSLQQLADDAFAAHTALILAEVANQSLIENEHWKALRATAYARFRAAMLAL